MIVEIKGNGNHEYNGRQTISPWRITIEKEDFKYLWNENDQT